MTMAVTVIELNGNTYDQLLDPLGFAQEIKLKKCKKSSVGNNVVPFWSYTLK